MNNSICKHVQVDRAGMTTCVYVQLRPCVCMSGRFTFERIHNTKEQIYVYKRAEIHKAKERLFESFKWAYFPGKHPDAGADQGFLERGFICIKYVGFTLWILLFILNILWKWNNLVSPRPNYFIFIEYLIAGRVEANPELPLDDPHCNALQIT